MIKKTGPSTTPIHTPASTTSEPPKRPAPQDQAGSFEIGGHEHAKGQREGHAFVGRGFGGPAPTAAKDTPPTGAIAHDGPKKIAGALASQALQHGGAEAGTAARAIHGANLTLEDPASLESQQKAQSLGPALAGAFKAMCPAGAA